MKRRVIIDLVTEVEENEPPSLLYDDIRQELCCCWHDVSFTMKHEDVDEPQIFICPIQNDYEALIEDEPQTYVINPQEPTNDEKCFECDDFFTCGGQCNKIKDEPQTCEDCKHNGEKHAYDYACDKCTDMDKFQHEDESQTEAEIAKAIVHKMIDDAVIAEDAYPDLRQKMHDAVDEYEPQTDCGWK